MLIFIAPVIKKFGVNAPINCFLSDRLIGGFTNGCIMMMFTCIVKDFSLRLIALYFGSIR